MDGVLDVLAVLEGGLLTTVQDLGRPEAAAWGVPRGGACDSWSHGLANALAGNPPELAALEITLAGPTLQARADCLLGLAGADLEARVPETGRHVEPGTGFVLRRGQTLTFASARGGAGIRSYLAIGGGLAVPPVLGSAATCLVGGFGGYDGRRLRPGDVLRGRRQTSLPTAERRASDTVQPALEASRRALRVLPGPHAWWLPSAALDRLLSVEYRVSVRGDRQAVVLEDSAPIGRTDERLLSLPMTWGAIQLPPDGQPICLLADHQTVGGYPVVAVVISADLPVLGQLGPGDRVRFRLVSPSEATDALRQREQAWQRLARELAAVS